jgi:hypothetical protein
MPKHFTHYWSNETWKRNTQQNPDGDSCDDTRGNQFVRCGVGKGDQVYVVTILKGVLFLAGRMTVGKIKRGDGEWKEWLIAEPGTATSALYNRPVPLQVTKSLRFVSATAPKPLKFITSQELDSQAIVGVRHLTATSAKLFDEIIEVGRESLDTQLQERVALLPEELCDSALLPEGAATQIMVNKYERSRKARDKCIGHYGYKCVVCSTELTQKYGHRGEGVIHVHHLKKLSEIGEGYRVDPIKDLRPICPNCHAIVHTEDPPVEIDVLRRELG